MPRRERPSARGLGTGMGGLVHAHQLGGVDLGVDLRRRQAGMPEQLLDGAQVPSPAEEMGREGVAERVGRGAVGQAEGAAQALHGELDDAGREGAAPHADEERVVGGERMRAEGEIGLDRPRHGSDDGHGAGLAALSDDGKGALDERGVLAGDAEGLRDPEPGTVEEGEHGGVARQDPGLAGLALAGGGIRDLPGRFWRQRLGQALRDLRAAHGGERGAGAVALALEEAGEGAVGGEGAHHRARLEAVGAAGGQKGPDVARGERGDVGERRRSAEMAGEEAQEGGGVAVIGLDGLRAQAPLGGEIGDPAQPRGREVGRGEDEGGCHVGALMPTACPTKMSGALTFASLEQESASAESEPCSTLLLSRIFVRKAGTHVSECFRPGRGGGARRGGPARSTG